ncbi:MAG: hypothetical protein H6721_03190 [Sandaracinus sp.]|nr:hypothetical protein [Sandaracinus sp.]
MGDAAGELAASRRPTSDFVSRDATRSIHVAGRVVVPPSLVAALQRGLTSPGGEVVLQNGDQVAHVFLARGSVAWVVTQGVPYKLGDVLESRAGIERKQLRPLLEECRNTGTNFGECLLSKGLVEREVLRGALLRHIAHHFLGLLRFADGALVTFKERPRPYGSELLFDVDELIGEAAMLAGSVPAPPPTDTLAPAAERIPGCRALFLVDVLQSHVRAAWPEPIMHPSTSLELGRAITDLVRGPLAERLVEALGTLVREDMWIHDMLLVSDDDVCVLARSEMRPSRVLCVVVRGGKSLGMVLSRARELAQELA